MRLRRRCFPFSRLACLFIFGLAAGIVSGCASVREPGPRRAPVSTPQAAIRPPVSTRPQGTTHTYLAAVDQQLRDEVARWEGTPHHMGGTNKRGVDCSGLVMVLYKDLFGVQLPRTTARQVTAGETVRQDELQPGDLVFFRPSKSRHVGIYLSNGEFAHASLSQGVTVSELGGPYWQDTYWTARRILQHVPDAAATRDKRPEPAQTIVETTVPEEAPLVSNPPLKAPFGW